MLVEGGGRSGGETLAVGFRKTELLELPCIFCFSVA